MAELDDSLKDPFRLCGVTIEGKYRVTSVVGDGGFGVVYRGVHTGFGEPIAVKCLKLPHALSDAQRDGFLEQLRDEGRLLHRLSKATPGIVQALDVGAVTTPAGAWVPFLVLEWLDGDTLADHLSKRLAQGGGAYGVAEAIRLIEPAARALAVAHAMKVAHRDVKPHNLFVAQVAGAGSASTLKVLDFGIAKVLTDYPTFTEALAATRAAPTAFTPRYGAPEQFNKARGASGPWTDVFALGLIVVELLSGKKALEGDDATQLYIASADPSVRPTPRARGAAVPDEVEAVLAKALAIEPKDRHGDAGEFIDALLAAAGLAPAAPTTRVSSKPTAPPIATSAAAVTVDEAARAREAKTLGVALTEAAPSAVARPAPAVVVTSASPGATPKPVSMGEVARSPAVDPMSETPFFERHHLPPSSPSAAPLAGAGAPAAVPPSRSWRGLAALAVVVGAGAAVYALVGDDLFPGGHARPAHSGVVLTTPLLPTRKHTDGGAAVPPTATSLAPPSSASAEAAVPPVDMVYVAPGSLRSGEGAGAHEVAVARGFYLDRTEVTARAYEACVAKRMCDAAEHVTLPPGSGERWNPNEEAPASDAGAASAGTSDAGGTDAGAADSGVSAAQSALTAEYAASWSKRCNGPRGAGDHPINCVDFAGAEAFCRWSGKRLPTDAEWELAARGAEGRAYPWGADAPLCGRACYDKNMSCLDPGAAVTTCAVGLHPADRTPEGIYDLGGDVAEWVADKVGDDRGSLRVVRGGSFIDTGEQLRAVARATVPPALAHVAVGFRCAMDAKGPPPAP